MTYARRQQLRALVDRHWGLIVKLHSEGRPSFYLFDVPHETLAELLSRPMEEIPQTETINRVLFEFRPLFERGHQVGSLLVAEHMVVCQI